MSTPQIESTLKIVELSAENVKRLKAVTIKPDGNTIVIGGNNGQGKSSTLDAIAYALGGKSLIPNEPIRKGQKNARVRVDLGEFVVERRFTASGSTLAVLSKDGAKYPSPQAILDKLVGDLSFDPLAFVSMKPSQQLETLKTAVGVSFADLEELHRQAYDERTVVNREVKQLEGQFNGLPFHEDAPEEPVSVESLLTELQQIKKHNAQVQLLANNKRTVTEQIQRVDDQVELVNDEIRTLQQRFEALNKQKKDLKARQAELLQNLKEYESQSAELDLKDEQPIMCDIQHVGLVNQKVQDNTRRRELEALLQAKREESENLTDRLSEIEKQKERRLAEAQFPVPTLSFSDSGVLLNGLPFEQASSAEQLRVSVAMGMAMNPRLKVLLIRDGSLLDENNLALLAQMASDNGVQVWLERVGRGQEVSVVIEDGMVAE